MKKILLLLIIFSGCAPGFFTVENLPPEKAFVSKTTTDFNEGNTDVARTIKILSYGDTLTIIGRKHTWYYAAIGKDTGFVFKEDVMNEPKFKSLNKLMRFSTEFKVHKSESDDAWGRANMYISKYSSMKLQTTSDNILETYNPSSARQFGYQITRAPIKDSVQFSVIGLSKEARDVAEMNAHVASYYIVTGILEDSWIVR